MAVGERGWSLPLTALTVHCPSLLFYLKWGLGGLLHIFSLYSFPVGGGLVFGERLQFRITWN